MSNKATTYAIDSLAASGIAVLDHRIAAIVRPGHWVDGIEARGDLGTERNRVALTALPGVIRYTAHLKGIDGGVLVLARSADRLDERLQWLTGLACSSLTPMDQVKAPAAGAAASVSARPPRVDKSGDRYAGRVTVEPPVTCAGCHRFTAAQSCAVPEASGIAGPNPNTPRRCLAFVPMWGSNERRTGAELWPELVE